MNNTIPSIRKAIHLIFELSKGNLTQVELSRKLGVTMSTTYRILCTLVADGWIIKRGDARYMLGGGMLPLLSFFRRDIAHIKDVQKIVDQIPQKTNLFGKLNIRDGLRHVEIYRSSPEEERMRIQSRIGNAFSLIDGPSGVALLIDETPEKLCSIYAAALETSHQTGDVAQFLADVAECKKNGYLLRQVGNSRWNVMVLAVPIRRGNEIVAALAGIGCPEDFKGKNEAKIANAIQKIAKSCQKLLESTEA